VRALALDLTNDLALTDGRLTLAEGTAAVAQRLRGRLGIWRGAWFADLSLGVPYITGVLGKRPSAVARATLQSAIATCPGVRAVEALQLEVDGDRNAIARGQVRAADGASVPFDLPVGGV